MQPTRRQLLTAGLAGILLWPRTSSAASIPYFLMDSLAHLSRWVVLVSEQRMSSVPADGYELPVLTCEVLTTFAGDLAIGARLQVEIDPVYTRELASDLFDAHTRELPLDQAVLFLQERDEATGRYRPVLGGVKPLVSGLPYRYGQFVSNPGPLCLDLQKAEIVKPAGEYDRGAFLEDVRRSVAAAAKLKKPRPIYPPPQ